MWISDLLYPGWLSDLGVCHVSASIAAKIEIMLGCWISIYFSRWKCINDNTEKIWESLTQNCVVRGLCVFPGHLSLREFLWESFCIKNPCLRFGCEKLKPRHYFPTLGRFRCLRCRLSTTVSYPRALVSMVCLPFDFNRNFDV